MAHLIQTSIILYHKYVSYLVGAKTGVTNINIAG